MSAKKIYLSWFTADCHIISSMSLQLDTNNWAVDSFATRLCACLIFSQIREIRSTISEYMMRHTRLSRYIELIMTPIMTLLEVSISLNSHWLTDEAFDSISLTYICHVFSICKPNLLILLVKRNCWRHQTSSNLSLYKQNNRHTVAPALSLQACLPIFLCHIR